MQIDNITVSSAGFKLSYETKSYTSEKDIGLYYGKCNGYEACMRSIVAMCSMIKPEFVGQPIHVHLNKNTHLQQILKAKNKSNEVNVALLEMLPKMHLDFSASIDPNEKQKQLAAAESIANYSMVKKRNDIK